MVYCCRSWNCPCLHFFFFLSREGMLCQTPWSFYALHSKVKALKQLIELWPKMKHFVVCHNLRMEQINAEIFEIKGFISGELLDFRMWWKFDHLSMWTKFMCGTVRWYLIATLNFFHQRPQMNRLCHMCVWLWLNQSHCLLLSLWSYWQHSVFHSDSRALLFFDIY